MPNRWAVVNGNWSSASTWSGSLIPTASDDVFANNFTVNVDTSFQVLSLRNTASASAIVAGGTFNFNTAGVSGSCTSLTPIGVGAANFITITAASGIVNISAPNAVVSGTGGNLSNVLAHTGNCDFIITGSSFSGGTGGSGIICISKTSTGTLRLVGNVVGGSSTAVANTSNVSISSTAGNIVIVGNITGGGGSNFNHGVSQTVGDLTIIGNLLGSNININNNAIAFSGTNLSISGSINAGTSAAAISCTSAASIVITGSITPSSAAPAISLSGASTFIYSGSLASSAGSPAIISSNAAAMNIFTGPFNNTNDTMAVQCVDMMLTPDASTSWNFGNITLFSPGRLAFYPSGSDIRRGVTYADGTVSGSLNMPPPTAVIAGTPTDNTTGSAVLTATQLQSTVWGTPRSSLTVTGSIGARVSNAATTDSTGKQIASYLI